MKFNDLTSAIHDAWTFAWPPVVACVLTYIIAHFMNPQGTELFLTNVLAALQATGTKIESLKASLEPYGLTQLIPVASFVMLIGFLYVLNGPVMIIVSRLPPNLSYRPEYLIGQGMQREDKLLLFRKYPTARSLNDAYYLAVQDYANSISKQDVAIPTMNRAEIYYKIHYLIKFAVVVATTLLLININNGADFYAQIQKYLWLLFISALLWLINLIPLLYQQEQQFFVDWWHVRLFIQSEAHTLLKGRLTAEEKKKLDENIYRMKWWRLDVINTDIVSWLRRTFARIRKY